MQTYFMHYRKIDVRGNVDGKGGATVAIHPTGHSLVIGIARCSPDDNFDRRMGRTIATGRIIAAGFTGRDQGRNVMVIQMDKLDSPIKDVVHEQLAAEMAEYDLY